ncbi:hypothetical protein BJ165DRAFT_115737 [Panaeolus papilionaceus]|nr:hypothetical protein BJ165DRAFT_115737 [Panaeolus papilionaceus]
MPLESIPFTPTPKQIIYFLFQLDTTRSIAVSAVVISFYDWILTFDDEVTFIWPSKWSIQKAIFIFNRYLNLLSQILMIIHFTGLSPVYVQSTCNHYVLAYGISVFLSLASVHILVLLRAWAIWSRQLWIAIFLGTAYVAYAAVCIALIILASSKAPDFFVVNVVGSCLSFTAPHLWLVWIASLALEFVSFGFTLASVSKYYHGKLSIRDLQPLARGIYHSALYYIAFSTLLHAFNMTMWVAYQRTPYNMLAVTFSCGLANVAGQRFVLSLHGMSQQTIAQEYMTSRLPQFSRMRLPNGTISNLDGPCNTVLTSIQEEEASQIVGSPSELPRIATASGW